MTADPVSEERYPITKSYRRKWLHKRDIIRQRGATYQGEINTNGERYPLPVDSRTSGNWPRLALPRQQDYISPRLALIRRPPVNKELQTGGLQKEERSR